MKHPLLLTVYGIGLLQIASVSVARSSSPLPPPLNLHRFWFSRSPPPPPPPPPPPSSQRKLPQYALLAFILILMAGLCVLICVVKTKRMCMERHHLQRVNQGASSLRHADSIETPGRLRQSQGLEPALVQALPLFSYRKVGIPEAIGIKGHGECPVCLSEFGESDVVRLLPNCKHLFHRDCIDTWLLSHPSCPLCREAVQLQKQTSLRKILTFLRGRSQREDGQGHPEAPQPGQQPALAAVSEMSPSGPPSGTSTELSTRMPPPQQGPHGQAATSTGTRDGDVGNLEDGTMPDAADEAGTRESSEAVMLGNRSMRRPSEDIRWAMSDTLATTTPRVVKRSSSLGREVATPRPNRMSAEDRRHSFGEMLRSSFKRDLSLSAPLPSQAETPPSPAAISRTSGSGGDLESGNYTCPDK